MSGDSAEVEAPRPRLTSGMERDLPEEHEGNSAPNLPKPFADNKRFWKDFTVSGILGAHDEPCDVSVRCGSLMWLGTGNIGRVAEQFSSHVLCVTGIAY